MSRVSTSAVINAPVEAVFAYVDDYKNTTRYMKDLTEWSPEGKATHGKGSKFKVAMQAGPLTLASVVDITTWEENAAIGFDSISGLQQSGSWTFKPSARGTEATLALEYQLPGGVAGRWLARAAEPIVRANVKASVEALKRQVEKRVAKRPKAASPVPSAAATHKPSAARVSEPGGKAPGRPSAAPSAKASRRKPPA